MDFKKTRHRTLLSSKSANTEIMCHKSTSVENDYFQTLPNELVLHIFQFLPQYKTLLNCCPQVCKKWKELSSDTSLWKNVFLFERKIHINKINEMIIFGVQDLRIKYCTVEGIGNKRFINKNYNIMGSAAYNCLRHLSLFRVVMTADQLEFLFLHCFHLTEISLYWQEISDTVCKYIARNENLIVLEIEAVLGDVSASAISEIFKKCTKIETLNISMSSAESYTAIFDAISPFSPMKNICFHSTTLLDKHIQNIVQKCPNLIKLDLAPCENLSSVSIKSIVDGLLKLQYLSIECNDSILPETLLELLRLRNLTNLEIFSTLPFPIEIRKKLEKSIVMVEIVNLLKDD